MIRNIMSIFSPNAPQQQAAPTNTPAVAPGTTQTPQQQQLENTPANQRDLTPAQNHPTLDPRPQTSAEEVKSPLEAFTALFHNEPVTKAGKPANPEAEYDPNAPIFNLDDEVFSKRVSAMSFMPQEARQELAQKIAAGETDAIFEAIEVALRNGYSQAAKFRALAAENAAKVAMDRSSKAVPGLLKGELTRQELTTQNKLFNDPALRPLAESISKQYRQRYPDASAADIARYTNHYFGSVAKALTDSQETKPKSQQEADSSGAFDFSNFWGQQQM